MRGKAGKLIRRQSGKGITPAYAGKSHRFHYCISVVQDHPRLCGEKHHRHLGDLHFLGSPPPMRGKDMNEVDDAVYPRITPAYAGKSDVIASTFGTIQDHPRLCGEKPKPPLPLVRNRGSPPPMRGKDVFGGLSDRGFGITPAYAGKRLLQRPVFLPSQDHPRLCGEKAKVEQDKPKVLGSPPPMRGKD